MPQKKGQTTDNHELKVAIIGAKGASSLTVSSLRFQTRHKQILLQSELRVQSIKYSPSGLPGH